MRSFGMPVDAIKMSVVVQPVAGTSGQVLTTQPVLQITNTEGTIAYTNTFAVTASLVNPTGTLTGTLTQLAVHGVVTFTDLVVSGPGGAGGSFTLAFSCSALPSRYATVTATGVTVASAARVASIVSVSRTAGSAAGGLSVTLTVTGLTGTPVFSFGGTAATTTGTSGSTQATVTVPAHATGKVDITCSGQTLANGFEYMPGSGSTLAAWSDAATESPFTPDSDAHGSSTVSTDVAFSGTRSIRCQRTQTGVGLDGVNQFLSPQFSPNTADHANGVFLRQMIYIPSATMAAIGDQIKLMLTRSNTGASNGSGYIFGVGSSFGTGGSSVNLTVYSDFDTGGTIAVSSAQGFGDGVWVEAIQQVWWDGSTGHGRVWIGAGGSLAELTGAAITNVNFLKGASDLVFQGGASYWRSNTATQNVYNDNVWIGTYWPDPATVT